MLGIYFTLLLTMFIVLIIGAVIGYSQSLDELKKPLLSSTKKYDEKSVDTKIQTLTKAWNRVQTDVSSTNMQLIEVLSEVHSLYMV